MWIKRANRRELGDILLNQRSSTFANAGRFEGKSSRYLDRDEVDLIWKEDPKQIATFPSICLVPRPYQQDFFAWINTYVPSLRPFSAFCQVIDPSVFEDMRTSAHPATLGTNQNVAVALILAETALQFAFTRDVRAMPVQSFLSSFSYSLSRAIAIGLPPELIAHLPDRWAQARSLSTGAKPGSYITSLRKAWSVLPLLSGRDDLFTTKTALPVWDPPHPLILRGCQDLLMTGMITSATWEQLSMGSPELTSMRERLNGPKEGRVAVFELALHEVRSNSMQPSIANFFLAFLANAISPGSLEHLNFLAPLSRAFPDVILWYGLLAGLSPQQPVLNSSNTARRLLREILRPRDLYDPPLCDISLDELEVLNKGTRVFADLTLGASNVGSIELFPGVNVLYRFGKFEDNPTVSATAETMSAVRDLEREMEQTTRAFGKLKRALGLEQESEASSKKYSKRKAERDLF